MKIQLSRLIFLNALSTMKGELSLLEFKMGKKSPEYLYIRKSIMDFTYKGLKKIFKTLSDEKIIVGCECKASLRKGYKDCKDCGGSGYRNV